MPPPPPGYRLLPIPSSGAQRPEDHVPGPECGGAQAPDDALGDARRHGPGRCRWSGRRGGVADTGPRLHTEAEARARQIGVQRGKRFLPHVLLIPTGTEVSFVNEDKMFHNVFSLAGPPRSIRGLRRGSDAHPGFSEPGPVRLLCNIHASMSAFVYVVDSPWYAQADAAGRFELRGIPPGEYVLHAWHETSARPSTQRSPWAKAALPWRPPSPVTPSALHSSRTRRAAPGSRRSDIEALL